MSNSTSYSCRLKDFQYLVVALFEAPLEQLGEAVREIVGEKFPTGRFVVERHVLNIGSVYVGRPPRGGAHPKRAVFFEPASAPGTTALIANLEDGWLTLCNVLASRVSGRHVLARTCIDEKYPLTDFEVWIDGESVRYVGAFREAPSWKFFVKGQPLEFEEPRNYKKRQIKNRFNQEILISYLSRLGWNILDDSFWCSNRNALYLSERS